MQLTLLLRDPPTNAEEFLAALRLLGLERITRCRLTRNRSVMVSWGGDELRAHRGYLMAPEDVLRAIVRFVEGRTRRERSQARRYLLDFPIEAGRGPRRRENPHAADATVAARLTAAHAGLNASHFGGSLRPLTVRVSRRMRSHLGHYAAATDAGDPPEIAISRRHLRRDGWDEVVQTLLHEMVHQWQDESGLAIDHGPRFRAKARALGISPFARRTVAA